MTTHDSEKRVEELLSEVGKRQAAELEQVQRLPLPEAGQGEAALRERIRREAGGKRPDGHGSPRLWMAAVAAAAALFVYFLVRPDETSADRPEDGVLLGNRVEIVAPVGAVPEFGSFRWNCDREGDVWYIVRVRSIDDAFPPRKSGSLTEMTWTPPEEWVDEWKGRIRWTVEVYAGSLEFMVDSADATAWLSP